MGTGKGSWETGCAGIWGCVWGRWGGSGGFGGVGFWVFFFVFFVFWGFFLLPLRREKERLCSSAPLALSVRIDQKLHSNYVLRTRVNYWFDFQTY